MPFANATYLSVGTLADHDVAGSHVRALRDGYGNARNAIVSIQKDDRFEQAFVPGASHFGLFAQYGELSDEQIFVTASPETAMIVHTITGETVIAANSVENLDAAVKEVRRHSKATLTLVIDGGAADDPADVEESAHRAAAIAAKHGLRIVRSAIATSFVELHQKHGPAAVVARVATPETLDQLGWGGALDGSLPVLPTSSPQDGASLLHDILNAIQRSVVMTVAAAVITACWILCTHLFALFPVVPYLGITSPEKRCGKTTLLRLFSRLCRGPLFTGNISMAAIYYELDRDHPTMLIDEADTFLAAKPELIGVLNSGHRRKGSVVRRMGNTTKRFSTFGPKVFAAIGELPETLADRCFEVKLQRKKAGEVVVAVSDEGPDELTLLLARILRWVKDNSSAVANSTTARPDLGNDRASDIAMPLLQIAEIAGGSWPQRLADALAEHTREQIPAPSSGELLLADIELGFREKGPRLTTANLLAYLHALPERQWGRFRHGQPLSARELAGLLRPYEITSVQMRDASEQVLRGYNMAQFRDAFDRYVPRSQ